MNDQSFEDAVARICERNQTYDAEAYFFVRDGLFYTSEKLQRHQQKNQHLSGAELCDGIREFALEQFGPMSSLVFAQWGVFETADFGAIVYALIAEGVFGKQKSDSQSDFDNLYSFQDAFVKPFEIDSPLPFLEE